MEPGALLFSWETEHEGATLGFWIRVERIAPTAAQVRVFVPAQGQPTGYGRRVEDLEPGTYEVAMREALEDGAFRAWPVRKAGGSSPVAASLQVRVE